MYYVYYNNLCIYLYTEDIPKYNYNGVLLLIYNLYFPKELVKH